MDPLHFKHQHCPSCRHGALQLSEVSLSRFIVLMRLERLSILQWWFSKSNKQTSLSHIQIQKILRTHFVFKLNRYVSRRHGKQQLSEVSSSRVMVMVELERLGCQQARLLLSTNKQITSTRRKIITDPLHWKFNHYASRRHGTLQLSEVSLSGFMVVVELERLSNQP